MGVAVLVTCLLGSALASDVARIPNPRPGGSWISDTANVIDAATESSMDARIDSLERDTGVEIAVVTVDRVTDGTPKELATELLNTWGVGKAGKDNGLVVLLSVGDRRVEMETGYGLEAALPDSWLGAMQTERMVPLFKLGNYAAALTSGLEAIDERIRRDPVMPPPNPASLTHPSRTFPAARPAPVTTRPTTTESLWWLGGVGGGLGLFAGLFVLISRRSDRTCPECRIYMPMLSEQEEDAHLDAGERHEEELGSVDHQIHVCPKCGYMAKFQSRSWFSPYSRCGDCQYRALRSSSETLVSASHSHGGEVEVRTLCVHCGASSTRIRHTPRLQSSSGSSSSWSGGSSNGGSSGGGSFGGGHSGGGGAGSSW